MQAPSAPPKMGAVGSPCSPVRAAKAAFPAPTCRGCRPHPCPVRPPPKGEGSPIWRKHFHTLIKTKKTAVLPSRGLCPQTPAPRSERGGARSSWGFAPNPTSFWHCPKGSEKASVFHRLGSLAGWKGIEAGRASPNYPRSLKALKVMYSYGCII